MGRVFVFYSDSRLRPLLWVNCQYYNMAQLFALYCGACLPSLLEASVCALLWESVGDILFGKCMHYFWARVRSQLWFRSPRSKFVKSPLSTVGQLSPLYCRARVRALFGKNKPSTMGQLSELICQSRVPALL
jgi:hypothetical protein